MEHGYVKTSDHDNALYYASIIPSDDIAFNDSEYKANLIIPIGVTELGSSTYCDIDDAPFIMDELSPTTFQVSMEKLKFRWGADVANFTDTTVTPNVNYDRAYTVSKVEDKDGTLNLRAYVEFSCVATVCLNTLATVQQSQIGTEIIDSNDLGVEIGNCFTRFINDPDIRGYFCRRFSGYKDTQLNVHYMRPGSNQYENDYQIYPEIILTDGYDLAYILEGGTAVIGSEYNDEDEFVPGDACGFYKPNNSVSPDYFYGVAQGQTSGFVPFPNTINLSTSNFGLTSHLPTNLSYPYTIDEINDSDGHEDDNNGNTDIKGIKFNRSQTPYHLYFGLVPGKTSLHKTVAKFFADKIDKVTLEGIGEKDPGPDVHNQNNITNTVKNPYSIYRTCLGQTQLPAATSSGFVPTGGLSSQGLGCDMVITALISDETYLNGNDGSISITPTLGIGPFTYNWNNGDTTQTITNLSPGTYQVTVTDFTGCQASLGELVITPSTTSNPVGGCKVYKIEALPHNDGTNNTGYVTYVDCNEVLQTNYAIPAEACYEICVAFGTLASGIDVSVTPTVTPCTISDNYPSTCGTVTGGGTPTTDPNYLHSREVINGVVTNITTSNSIVTVAPGVGYQQCLINSDTTEGTCDHPATCEGEIVIINPLPGGNATWKLDNSAAPPPGGQYILGQLVIWDKNGDIHYEWTSDTIGGSSIGGMLAGNGFPSGAPSDPCYDQCRKIEIPLSTGKSPYTFTMTANWMNWDDCNYTPSIDTFSRLSIPITI